MWERIGNDPEGQLMGELSVRVGQGAAIKPPRSMLRLASEAVYKAQVDDPSAVPGLLAHCEMLRRAARIFDRRYRATGDNGYEYRTPSVEKFLETGNPNASLSFAVDMSPEDTAKASEIFKLRMISGQAWRSPLDYVQKDAIHPLLPGRKMSDDEGETLTGIP
jgi:hypothetical protein